MELLFVAVLVLVMAGALAAGYPVAFALPGSAILTIALAALTGWLFANDSSAYFHQGDPIQWLSAGVTNFRGVYWEVERDTLIAIPLFVFMGIMLQRSRIAEDLLVTMAQLFGPVPGGLGISVVLVGALLAATTGIVGATVVAMGLISLPAMLRNNYSHPLATGTICASGTLGQIIPPSIVLIILADQLASATDQAGTLRKAAYQHGTGSSNMPSEFQITSTSAGDMFLGAFLPGIVLVGLYVLYILVWARIRPKTAPPVPYEGNFDRKFALRVALALIPPLTLILAVLGSIILGIATVNQAGAIGAVGATIMAGYRLCEGRPGGFRPAILAGISVAAIMVLLTIFDINVKNIRGPTDLLGIVLAATATTGLVVAVVWSAWRTFKIDDTLRGVMLETAKTTSMVFIILLGAAMLTAAFRAFGGEELVKEFLTGLPGGFWTQMIVVMAVIFVLGFFLDFIEIAVVVVPIVAPILLADPSANITAVWLGVMIGINIQTSFLTPPFGFALFYLRGVASKVVRTISIYRGVVPFIGLQLLALVIAGAYPPLVNYLPYRASLTAETAPPPINPRLQGCIEQDLFEIYRRDENRIRASIDAARTLDLATLPEKHRAALRASFDAAAATFALVEAVTEAQDAVDVMVPDYRPLHREVRYTQRQIRRLEDEMKTLRRDIRRAARNGGTNDGRGGVDIEELRATRVELAAEAERLATTVPAEWDGAHERYVALARTANRARFQYRRNADNAYKAVAELQQLLGSADALAPLAAGYGELQRALQTEGVDASVARLRAFERTLIPVAGSSKIRSTLTKARRALTRGGDTGKALKLVAEAAALHAAEAAWRTTAAAAIADGLRRYEAAIRDTIGLRQQPRMDRDRATSVAACLAHHRDISLSF